MMLDKEKEKIIKEILMGCSKEELIELYFQKSFDEKATEMVWKGIANNYITQVKKLADKMSFSQRIVTDRTESYMTTAVIKIIPYNAFCEKLEELNKDTMEDL